MPDTPDKKLTPLQRKEQQAAQLAEQIRGLKARQALQDRKDDTRRKVIAGALALEHLEKNPNDPFSRKILSLIDEYARPNERRLFEHLGIKPNMAQEPANDEDPSLKQEFNR